MVRGDDLLSQSPGQAILARLLGYPTVTYAHVPLVLAQSGARLAKRDGAVTIEELAERGVTIAQIIEVLARSMGVEGVHSASQLLESMDVEKLRALPPKAVDTRLRDALRLIARRDASPLSPPPPARTPQMTHEVGKRHRP